VLDKNHKVMGIISDGDLRRALARGTNILDMMVEDIMSPSPKTIDENQTTAEALGIMELYEITHLVIADKHNRVKGILHLHDILGREEFRVNGYISSASRPCR
ncbi:MAG TPA: KpsF/GutQ family sugar-phosphate isomerase, partial [Desulfobacteraceae bacterium]|nr:KpsF/GutQ family sugar-phosphate isomerase [Desulfobacteraceae bacterium]